MKKTAKEKAPSNVTTFKLRKDFYLYCLQGRTEIFDFLSKECPKEGYDIPLKDMPWPPNFYKLDHVDEKIYTIEVKRWQIDSERIKTEIKGFDDHEKFFRRKKKEGIKRYIYALLKNLKKDANFHKFLLFLFFFMGDRFNLTNRLSFFSHMMVLAFIYKV